MTREKESSMGLKENIRHYFDLKSFLITIFYNITFYQQLELKYYYFLKSLQFSFINPRIRDTCPSISLRDCCIIQIF